MDKFFRDTYAVVSLDNLAFNVKSIKDYCIKDHEYYTVIKANGYGHGASQIANTCINAGATRLAVATLDEALSLRKDGINHSILVLGPTRVEDLGTASDYDISVTCPNVEWARLASTTVDAYLKVHLKMDTGMNRIGVTNQEQVDEVVTLLKNHPMIDLEGAFTHFATADEDEAYLFKQIEAFKNYIANTNYTFRLIHASNSASTLKYMDMLSFCNAFRVGIALYGYNPFEDTKNLAPLKPAIEIYSHITNIKKVEAHQKVGYGATYDSKEEYIATLAYGYADGFLRRQNICQVNIEGKLYPVAGRVCMDQMMIALDKYYPIGTKVGISTDLYGIDDIAKATHTIPHEILCSISKRMPRLYVKDGVVINITNDLLK